MGLRLVSVDTQPVSKTTEKLVVYRNVWSLAAFLQTVLIFILVGGTMTSMYFLFKNLTKSPDDKLMIFGIVGVLVTCAVSVFSYFTSQQQSFINDLCNRYDYGVDNFLNAKNGPNQGNLRSEHINVRRSAEEQRVMLPKSSKLPDNVSVFVVRDKSGVRVEEVTSL